MCQITLPLTVPNLPDIPGEGEQASLGHRQGPKVTKAFRLEAESIHQGNKKGNKETTNNEKERNR